MNASFQDPLSTTEPGADGLGQVDVKLSRLSILNRGEPHLLAVARDITSRRVDEARLLELEDQVRQAQKMEAIGHLTSGIAHDFNNILATVIGYLSMAQERAAVHADPYLARQLDQAHLASRRAQELIAQMLDFARAQRGERRPTSLSALVDQTVQLLSATLPSSVLLAAEAPATLPLAEVDSVQIEQVLFNLCINARDAVQSRGSIRVRLQDRFGGGWRCASCRVEVPSKRWLELSVSDDGCGISEEVTERMFDPFYSTKEKGKGSGMGLPMVHTIAHDHGGHLLVETAPGRGATFRVLLPPSVRKGHPSGPSRSPRARPAAAAPMQGRVVVVEDEAMVGDFMAELLGNWGLEVEVLRDPLHALQWLGDSSHRADLVITDQVMPRMSGLELAAHIARLRPTTPVVLYTGDAIELSAAGLAHCGVRTVLRKPVDLNALRFTVQSLLEADDPTATRMPT